MLLLLVDGGVSPVAVLLLLLLLEAVVRGSMLGGVPWCLAWIEGGAGLGWLVGGIVVIFGRPV